MAVAGIISIRPDTKSKVQCGMAKYALCNLCNSDCIALFPNMPEVMVNVLVIADML